MSRKAYAYCVLKVNATFLRSHRRRYITMTLHTNVIFDNEMSHYLENFSTVTHWKNAFSEFVGTVFLFT